VITTTATLKFKTCTKCKLNQPQSEFGRNAHMRDGLNYQCKTCMKEVRDRRKLYVTNARKR